MDGMFNIVMPVVKLAQDRYNLPHCRPILVRCKKSKIVSTIIIGGDDVLWFDTDGFIRQSSLVDFIEDSRFEVIRVFDKGDTLTITAN